MTSPLHPPCGTLFWPLPARPHSHVGLRTGSKVQLGHWKEQLQMIALGVGRRRAAADPRGFM